LLMLLATASFGQQRVFAAEGDETCRAGDASCGQAAALPCIMFRQTQGCDPRGARESKSDRPCSEEIPMGISGFCQCGKGNAMRRVRESTCDHRPFVCATECLQAERYQCIMWRQTGGCSADGERDPQRDQPCDALISARSSGFCECGDGRTIRKPGCAHGDFAEDFRCADECAAEAGLYEELGLDSSATEKAIKQTFRKLSLKYHPDKTRDDPKLTARFAAIREAYEMLVDPEQRAAYDSSGFQLLEDLKRGKAEKGPALNGKVEVTLEQLYNGQEFMTSIQRTVICRGCANKQTARCKRCNAGCANEFEIRNVRMGPMVMQQRVEVPSKERCRKEQTELLVSIERGMSKGDQLTFKAMGEHQPKKVPGDVILTLGERQHEVFRRMGNDLHTDIEISLKEALLGFERSIRHMDGRRIVVQMTEVTPPNGIMRVQGEGMPHRGDPTSHGDLFIKCRINMPEASDLTEPKREWLRANFPG